jgi:hypothetical protein
MLHGRIVWQEATTGEWIAVIEIEKIRNAKLDDSRFQSFKLSKLRVAD